MNERERRAADQLRAEQGQVRDAAGVVRSAPELHQWAGLARPDRADQLGELLDMLADRLDTFDDRTRGHVVRVCGDMLGLSMDQASIRRTRRR